MSMALERGDGHRQGRTMVGKFCLAILPGQRDLQTQLEFIEGENPDIVTRVATQIRKATESLDSFPRIGRDGVVAGTLELVIPRLPFVCVYRLREGQVEILRLLHERMLWPR